VIVSERVRRRLAGATRFTEIVCLEEVDSTNRWLLQRAAAGAPEGVVAVADRQTAGRGRRGRAWEAPAGTSLLVSVLLRPRLDAGRWHVVNSAVALAARRAVAEVAGFTPELKWPNDLMAGGRKLAGLLAEAAGSALVVGLGCNVTWAPDGAASVQAEAGKPIDRALLLEALLVGVEGWYGRWDEAAVAYRQACSTVGRPVRVERPCGNLEGRAEGIDAAGRLLVRVPGRGVEAVAVGDVVHLRLASGA
jgi:BirA family biotin operon repressor/biotin-[acetyl-CoA-carboxylase] ligase